MKESTPCTRSFTAFLQLFFAVHPKIAFDVY